MAYTIYRRPSVSIFFNTGACLSKRVNFNYVSVDVCVVYMHTSTGTCGKQKRLSDR